MHRPLSALLLPAAALLLSACGAHQPSGTTSSTTGRTAAPATSAAGTQAPVALPTLSPDVSATLAKYSLTQADLPSGFSLGVQQQLPNQGASSGYADPAAVQQEIEQTGREGGIAQQVFSTTSAGEIGVTIELFKDAAGAKQWTLHPPQLSASMNPTPATLPQPLGEAATAVHWSQNGQAGYVVSFQRGRIVFGLGVSAPAGQESLNTIMPLAKALDAKAQKQTS